MPSLDRSHPLHETSPPPIRSGAARSAAPVAVEVRSGETMKLLRFFARAYPLASLLMLGSLLLAAGAELLGVSSLFALFSVLGSDPQASVAAEGSSGGMAAKVIAFIEKLGLEPTLGVVLVVALFAMWLKAALLLVARRQVGNTVARSAMDLRLRLLGALMTTRWSYFIHQPMGSVAASFATEAERASGAYLNITTVVSLLIQSALYSAIALAISWQAAVGGLVVAVLGMLILRFLVRATRKAGVKQTRVMRTLLSRLTDTLQALKPLKAMAREDQIAPLLESDTLKLNRVARKKVLAAEALVALQEPLVGSSLAFGVWLCLTVLGMTAEAIGVLGYVFLRMLLGLSKAQRQYQKYTVHESAFWALLETIDRAEREREENPGTEHARLEREIRLDHIALSFGPQKVFDDVSLVIPAGKITGLVGPSGSGKTTISDLIIGLLGPDSGEVRIDDLPLTQIDLRSWRESIGYVPQEMFLINDSIATNITLGDESLDAGDVESALRRAGAWEFVSELPEGVDSLVGERGARLSGGQRQRIAIARALVRKPCLLVLDEATTALDPETEAAVWDALTRLKGQVTVLAVSHQPALIDTADRVYRIEGGKATLEKSSADECTAAGNPGGTRMVS